MNVPLLDLVAQYRDMKDELLEAVMAVIERQSFIMGPEVGQLETAVAALSRTKHAIGCASGTDALLLPLKALDLRDGLRNTARAEKLEAVEKDGVATKASQRQRSGRIKPLADGQFRSGRER